MSLIQWVPEIVQATDQDILRFGPQAARVRALLDFIPGMRDREGVKFAARKYVSDTHAFDLAEEARLDAWNKAFNAAAVVDREIAGRNANNAASQISERILGYPARRAAADAARAEAVSDILDPQSYRILTGPLNAARIYELRLPDAGSEFMRLVDKLNPTTADDIERLADLSVDPQAQGILELLGGLQGGMPLAAKIDAARRLDRASRAGRRLS